MDELSLAQGCGESSPRVQNSGERLQHRSKQVTAADCTLDWTSYPPPPPLPWMFIFVGPPITILVSASYSGDLHPSSWVPPPTSQLGFLTPAVLAPQGT